MDVVNDGTADSWAWPTFVNAQIIPTDWRSRGREQYLVYLYAHSAQKKQCFHLQVPVWDRLSPLMKFENYADFDYGNPTCSSPCVHAHKSEIFAK